ncbi:MAG: trypsin-like peptidase domain-containing protein [Caldilineaceae bacterium]
MGRTVKRIAISIVLLSAVVALVIVAAGNITWTPARQVAAVDSLSSTSSIQPVNLQQQTDITTEASQEVLAQLYRDILPSIVNIQVTTLSTVSNGFNLNEIPSEGQGSGWIWDDTGHIVTNNHVVEDAESITVYFSNGEWTDAALVAADPQADLAVIKVTPPADFPLQPIPLAADIPPVGYTALAFGSPFGLSGTMTRGIISAVGRSFAVGSLTDSGATYSLPEVIQTDAAINPGNSGGPLLNLNGEVIGVNFAIRSEVRANSGVGFAIPVSVVHRVVPALIDQGYFNYPYLGIAGSTINPIIAERQELPEGMLGVFVSQIAGTPARNAGIEENDIILGIDDVEVRSFEDLIGYLITSTEPGQDVNLRVYRDGEEQIIELTVGERPR